VATATTKHRKGSPSPSRGPRKRPTQVKRPRWLIPVVAACVLAAGIGLVAVLALRPGSEPASAGGLPRTSDYHSLLVAPSDPNTLLLGTHDGLFRTSDGGVTWAKAELEGQDAMSLAQPTARTVWAAGHDLLAKSLDGGSTWQDVRPAGLPGLDVHGFAVDPRVPDRLYAAVAGQGLYRSDDAGQTFELVSRVVGPGVMALAVLADGRVVAGDAQRQVLAVSGNGGKDWKGVVEANVMGLAANPKNPRLVLASGPGVLRSTDGGRIWKQTLSLDAGAGPIAWSASEPKIAYVVGLDRSLWRSGDSGTTWAAVLPGEED